MSLFRPVLVGAGGAAAVLLAVSLFPSDLESDSGPDLRGPAQVR